MHRFKSNVIFQHLNTKSILIRLDFVLVLLMSFHPIRWSDHIITCSTFQDKDIKSTYLYGVTGNTIPAVVTTTSNTVYVELTPYGSTKLNTKVYNWQATYTAVTRIQLCQCF
jgi:hypothetical protein